MNRTSLTSLLRGWKRGAGKRLPALLAAGALAAMLNSCGDNVVETKSESQRIKDATNKTASVSIYIRNGGGTGDISNADVAVEFYGTSGSSYEVQSVNLATETKGKYHEVFRGGVIFKDVPIGTYAARVSKSEYATYFVPVEVKYDEAAQSENDVLVVKSVAENAWLYPLTGSVSGSASLPGLKKAKAGGKAENATVTLTIADGRIESRVFTKTTGSDGSFKFEGLPSGTNADGSPLLGVIRVNVDGYEPATASVPLVPDVNTPVGKELIVSRPADDDGIALLDYPVSVEASGDISFSFSTAIDPLSVVEGAIEVEGTSGKKVGFTASSSGSKVVLSPKGDSWQRNDNDDSYAGNDKVYVSFNRIVGTNGGTYTTGSAGAKEVYISTPVPNFYIVSEENVNILSASEPVTVKFSQPVNKEKFFDGSFEFQTTTGARFSPYPEFEFPSFSEDNKELTFKTSNSWPISRSGKFVLKFTQSFYSEHDKTLPADNGDAVTVTYANVAIELLAISTVNGKAYKREGSSSAQAGYNKVGVSAANEGVVFAFNKAIDRTVEPNVYVTASAVDDNGKILTTGANISVDKSWSADNKQLTLTPRSGWKQIKSTAAGHVVRLVGFKASDSDPLSSVGSDNIAALVVYLETPTLEYTGKDTIRVARIGKEPIELPFDLAINADSIGQNNLFEFKTVKAPNKNVEPVAVTNFVTAALVNDGKTVRLTPTGNWNFTIPAGGYFVDDVLEISGIVALYADNGDARGLKISGIYIARPQSKLAKEKVENLKITYVDTTVAGHKSPYPGGKVNISFDRIANDKEDGLGYRLYRRLPNQKLSTATVVKEWNNNALSLSTTLSEKNLADGDGGEKIIGGGLNAFFVVPYQDDGSDIEPEGVPSNEVELTTVPVVLKVSTEFTPSAPNGESWTVGSGNPVTEPPSGQEKTWIDQKYYFWWVADEPPSEFSKELGGTITSTNNANTAWYSTTTSNTSKELVIYIQFSEPMNVSSTDVALGRYAPEALDYKTQWKAGTDNQVLVVTLSVLPGAEGLIALRTTESGGDVKYHPGTEAVELVVGKATSTAGVEYVAEYSAVDRRGNPMLDIEKTGLNIIFKYDQPCVTYNAGFAGDKQIPASGDVKKCD